MLLCDFFPLYDFSADTCSTQSQEMENQGSPSNGNGDNGLTNESSLSENKKNENSISYGLQRRAGPAITELVLIVWILSLVLEEIRQVANDFDAALCSHQVVSTSSSPRKPSHWELPLLNTSRWFGISSMCLRSFYSSLDSLFDSSTAATVFALHGSFSRSI